MSELPTFNVNEWWVTTFGANADLARMVSSFEVMAVLLFCYATLKVGKASVSEKRSVYVLELITVVLAVFGAIVLFALLK